MLSVFEQIRYKSVFCANVAKIAPHVQFTQCMLHRYALSMRTIPNDMKDVLIAVIKMINYIKASTTNSRIFRSLCEEMGAHYTSHFLHTEVRWLSQGRILTRFVQLKNEVILFLFNKRNEKEKLFYENMTNNTFIQTISYLMIFPELSKQITESSNGNCSITNSLVEHISSTFETIQKYHPYLNERYKLQWILKPFDCDENNVPDDDISAKR